MRDLNYIGFVLLKHLVNSIMRNVGILKGSTKMFIFQTYLGSKQDFGIIGEFVFCKNYGDKSELI